MKAEKGTKKSKKKKMTEKDVLATIKKMTALDEKKAKATTPTKASRRMKKTPRPRRTMETRTTSVNAPSPTEATASSAKETTSKYTAHAASKSATW